MLLLIIIVTSALSVSFLCSVLEATLLSVRDAQLARLAEEGNLGAAVLLELRRERVEDAISAILTYNTIAHTIGAALAGAQAAHVFGDAWVGVFSGVLTVLILVITEIIPKTLGTVHAVRLSGFVGKVINIMVKPPMKWILVLTRGLTRLVAGKQEEKRTTRGDILAMVQIAAREGSIPRDEGNAVARLLKLQELAVEAVMTPRTVLVAYPKGITVADALEVEGAQHFSRIPVYEDTRDNMLGYVLTRELLQVPPEERAELTIDGLLRPILLIAETMTLSDALRYFTSEREHLAVVHDEHGGTSGIVTLEDLVETALGVEIVDESDSVADLRRVASRIRDERLARHAARRDEARGGAQRAPE